MNFRGGCSLQLLTIGWSRHVCAALRPGGYTSVVGTDFDEAAIRRKADRVIESLFHRTAAQAQRIFDAVFQVDAGKTADDAEAHLKQALAVHGLRLFESELRRAAAAIGENKHIAIAD